MVRAVSTLSSTTRTLKPGRIAGMAAGTDAAPRIWLKGKGGCRREFSGAAVDEALQIAASEAALFHRETDGDVRERRSATG